MSQNCVLQKIVKHVPEIEEIVFESWVDHIECLTRLRKLKTLKLTEELNGSYLQPIMHEIVSANPSLEFLELERCDLSLQNSLKIFRKIKR